MSKSKRPTRPAGGGKRNPHSPPPGTSYGMLGKSFPAGTQVKDLFRDGFGLTTATDAAWSAYDDPTKEWRGRVEPPKKTAKQTPGGLLLNAVWERFHRKDPLADKVMTPAMEKVYRRDRKTMLENLRTAKRFVLDQQAARTVVDLATAQPEQVLGWLPLARLPFEKVWVEWDQWDRIEYAHDLGTAHPPEEGSCPRRMGALMVRHSEDPDRFGVTFFASYEQGPLPSTIAYLVDLNRTEQTRTAALNYWADTLVSDGGIAPDVLDRMEGFSWGWQTGAEQIVVPIGLTGSFVPVPEWGLSFLIASQIQLDLNKRDRQREMADHLTKSVVEQRGDARWIITLLAILNQVPRTETEEPPPKGKFLAHGAVRPYLSHSTVRINIPAKAKPSWVARHMASIVRKHKRHDVRGHWRTADKPPARTGEGKVWLPYTCMLTGKQRWRLWIEEHQRGDANIGFVIQDYAVTAKE